MTDQSATPWRRFWDTFDPVAAIHRRRAADRARYRNAIEIALAELTGVVDAGFDRYERECFNAAVRVLSRALDQERKP